MWLSILHAVGSMKRFFIELLYCPISFFSMSCFSIGYLETFLLNGVIDQRNL